MSHSILEASRTKMDDNRDKISDDARAATAAKLGSGSCDGCSPQTHASTALAAGVQPTVRTPSDEELQWLQAESARLERATAEERIRWAVKHYYPKLTMATAFGPEGCLILSMLAEIEPRVRVFNLDTGYQFEETIDTRNRIAEKYGIEVELAQPDQSIEAFEAEHGGPLHETDPDRCCFLRKIVVLRREICGYEAWIAGIRRDQSPHRAGAPIVGWDAKFGLAKINPLADWTKQDVWKRIVAEGVPYNPLHDRGYPSVGCRPCTRPVLDGEDERAGRWSGRTKTECGLHLSDTPSPESPGKYSTL